MAGKKALFVGINTFAKYPQFALNGCVNDARDMAALYKELLGFKPAEMTVFTNVQATKANIMSRLKAMVTEAKTGKLHHLLFSFSSHGTQMKDNSGDEPDGMDEAFVPYDIDQNASGWNPSRIICDDEFHALFSSLPANVLLEVFLDTCHSGTGLRNAAFGLHAARPRYVAPPQQEFSERAHRVRGFTLNARGTTQAVAGQHHLLWTGCKSSQTSADAYFSGRYSGAFTYHFIKVMRESRNKLSRKDVIARVRALMKNKFSQVPQLEGNATNRARAIAY